MRDTNLARLMSVKPNFKVLDINVALTICHFKQIVYAYLTFSYTVIQSKQITNFATQIGKSSWWEIAVD